MSKKSFRQHVLKEFGAGAASCTKGKASRGKLPSGRTWTFTPTCLKVATARIGKAVSKPRNAVQQPGASAASGLTPSPVCPPAPSENLQYDRFDLCAYVPLSETGVLNTDPDEYQITVNYDVEMWAELDNVTRSWTVDAIITPTSIIDPPDVPLTAEVGLGCTDPDCTVTPDDGTPADGDLGTLTVNDPLDAQFGVSDTANAATVNLNNIFQFAFLPVGYPCDSVCEPVDVLGFGTQQARPIRCDSAGTQTGYTKGCAVWEYDPIWVTSDSVYPSMDLVVKHMALATGNLQGYNGLPGDPGRNTPLTYISRSSTEGQENYAAACGGQTAPPDQQALGNTSCDEYPLASSAQGAASGDPYSICWVPPTANNAQGTYFSAFLKTNRVLIGDNFYVDAIYQGDTPGCTDNLGGGGSITPDNTLDSMFGNYGDNATCADWSGGDATNSVVLPDGERAWFFSDTYLNSPAERKTIWYASSVHNSIVMQGASGLTKTITGGNTCQETNLSLSFWDRYAKTPAVPPDGSLGGFYWTADQMLVGSNVIKFYYHGDPTPGSFSINYPAVATIPASSLEDDTSMTITPAQFSCGASNIIWGTALLSWNGNVYVYGWQSNGTGSNGIYLAKTTSADLASPGTWQLYDGMSGSNPVWGSCSSSPAALPISNGTTGFSVDSVNNSLWLVQFDYTNGQAAAAGAIGAHPSTTPWGFGNDTVPLYDPPTGNHIDPYYYQDYEARIQPGLGAAGQVVISYNVNTTAVDTGCISANLHDAAIYRPRFIDVPVSDFDPSDAVAAPGTSTAAARNATGGTRTGTAAVAAAHGFPGYGIRDSGPPFATSHRPVPPPGPAKSAAARSTSAQPTAAGTANATDAAGGEIDGSSDWFDKPLGGSCPTISAPPDPPSLTADSDGLVTATWDNMGTDVWYYAWVCDETQHNCSTEGTSAPWVPAWPTSDGNLWSTGTSADIAPAAAILTGLGQLSAGDTYAIYISDFGAGNGSGGGNSPEATVTVPVQTTGN